MNEIRQLGKYIKIYWYKYKVELKKKNKIIIKTNEEINKVENHKCWIFIGQCNVMFVCLLGMYAYNIPTKLVCNNSKKNNRLLETLVKFKAKRGFCGNIAWLLNA